MCCLRFQIRVLLIINIFPFEEFVDWCCFDSGTFCQHRGTAVPLKNFLGGFWLWGCFGGRADHYKNFTHTVFSSRDIVELVTAGQSYWSG